jgi:hypothetical protein
MIGATRTLGGRAITTDSDARDHCALSPRLRSGFARQPIKATPDHRTSYAGCTIWAMACPRTMLRRLATALAAVILLGAPVKAEQAARPIETCSGRVTAFVGTGELIPKGVRMLHVTNGEGCGFFVTERDSANGKRILRTCPIGSNCRIEARLWGGDGGIRTLISVKKID